MAGEADGGGGTDTYVDSVWEFGVLCSLRLSRLCTNRLHASSAANLGHDFEPEQLFPFVCPETVKNAPACLCRHSGPQTLKPEHSWLRYINPYETLEVEHNDIHTYLIHINKLTGAGVHLCKYFVINV